MLQRPTIDYLVTNFWRSLAKRLRSIMICLGCKSAWPGGLGSRIGRCVIAWPSCQRPRRSLSVLCWYYSELMPKELSLWDNLP